MDKKIEFTDSKTILQERVQDNGDKLIYELVEEIGPAHDREYVVNALINGEVKGTGRGKTKKSAEQMAAYQILNSMTK